MTARPWPTELRIKRGDKTLTIDLDFRTDTTGLEGRRGTWNFRWSGEMR